MTCTDGWLVGWLATVDFGRFQRPRRQQSNSRFDLMSQLSRSCKSSFKISVLLKPAKGLPEHLRRMESRFHNHVTGNKCDPFYIASGPNGFLNSRVRAYACMFVCTYVHIRVWMYVYTCRDVSVCARNMWACHSLPSRTVFVDSNYIV